MLPNADADSDNAIYDSRRLQSVTLNAAGASAQYAEHGITAWDGTVTSHSQSTYVLKFSHHAFS